jgi:hypothetical protein
MTLRPALCSLPVAGRSPRRVPYRAAPLARGQRPTPLSFPSRPAVAAAGRDPAGGEQTSPQVAPGRTPFAGPRP